MPLPSLYISGDSMRAWSITRAAGYGAVVGGLAALFKMMNPLRGWANHYAAGDLGPNVLEIAGAMLAFALLCAAASALRNFIARKFIWIDR
jgi:hypothetical protein